MKPGASPSAGTSATTAQVAHGLQTTPATLRRWVKRGLIPQYAGAWTPAAVAHARLVARISSRTRARPRVLV